MAGTLTTNIKFNGIDNVSAMLSRLQKNVSAAASRMNAGFDAGARRLAGMGQAATVGITAPTALFGGMAAQNFAEIEQTWNRVSAVTGIATDQMREMKDVVSAAAQDMGFKTNDIAEGLEEIVKSGVRAKDALAIVDDAAAGARAAGQDRVGTWANAITDIQAGFFGGASDAAEFERQYKRMQDLVVMTADNSSADPSEILEFMRTFAPAARGTGTSLENAYGIAKALADRGLKGADSGRGARSAILKIVAPEAKGLKTLNSLGIDLEKYRFRTAQKILGGDLAADTSKAGVNLLTADLDRLAATANQTGRTVESRVDSMVEQIKQKTGSLSEGVEANIRDSLTARIAQSANVDIVKVMEELRKKGLSPDQMRDIFGLEGFEYASAILDGAPEAAEFAARAAAGADGYTKTFAERMKVGLAPAFRSMLAGFEAFNSSLFEPLSSSLQSMMRAVGAAASRAGDFFKENPGAAKLVGYVTAIATAFGPLAIVAGYAAIGLKAFAGAALAMFAPVTRAVSGVIVLGRALAVLAVAKPLTSLAGLLRLGAVGTVLAGAAAGALALWNSLSKLKEVAGPSLAAGFNELGNALDSILTGNGKGWIHFAKAGDRFKEALSGAGSVMAEALAGAGPLGQAVLNAADAVGGFVSTIADLDIVKTAGGWLSSLWLSIKSLAGSAATVALNALAAGLQALDRVLQAFNAGGFLAGWRQLWSELGGSSIGHLPGFAPALDGLRIAFEKLGTAGVGLYNALADLFNFARAEAGSDAWSQIASEIGGFLAEMARVGIKAATWAIELLADGLQSLADAARAFKETTGWSDSLKVLSGLVSPTSLLVLAGSFTALTAALRPLAGVLARVVLSFAKLSPMRIFLIAAAVGALADGLGGLSGETWAAIVAGILLVLPYLGKALGVVGRLAGRFGILAGAIARVAKGLTGLKNIKVPPVPRAPRAPATVPNRPGPTGPKIPMSTTPANPPAGKPGIGLGWWKGLGLAALGVDAALQTEGKSKEEIEALFHERGKSFSEMNEWLSSMLPKAFVDALHWSLPGAIGDAFAERNAERRSLDAAASGQMDDRARRGRAGNAARWQEQQNQLLDLKLGQPTGSTGILNSGPLPPLGDPVLAGAGSGLLAGQQARTTEAVDALRAEFSTKIDNLASIMTQAAGAARDTASSIAGLPSAIRSGIMAGVNRAAPVIAPPPGAGRGLTPG